MEAQTQHGAGKEAARAADAAFFREHPQRLYRARTSIAFEREEWGARDHLALPITLVIRPRADIAGWVTVPLCGDLSALPDDDLFLGELWLWLQAAVAVHPDGRATLPPLVHGMLLTKYGFTSREMLQ